jgi:uncharacterized protein
MKEVRRKDKQTSNAEACSLLDTAEYGVLSTVDADGQPYGVPLNFVYKNNCIYVHCAMQGHKLENLANNPKASFCVVENAEIIPSNFSTKYQSAIAFGIVSEVQGQERYDGFLWLLEKYSPNHIEEGKEYTKKMDKATKLIKIEVQHISGKKSPLKE